MSSEEHNFYTKVNETISRFKDGKRLYRRSPIFNVVVQSLVRGADVYEVIEQLVLINEDTQRALEHQILGDTRPRVHIPSYERDSNDS